MSVSDRHVFYLKVDLIKAGCIYFCSHFYKAFKYRTSIKDASILKNHLIKEALCYCSSCKTKIKKCLRNHDTLNDEFFFEGRKLLIQHYPKVYDKNNLVICMSPSSSCKSKIKKYLCNYVH